MFIVIYSFEVHPGQEQAFEDVWQALTEAIYLHCGSLGSRLHAEASGRYIAYAQWPNREQWKNSPELPEAYAKLRQHMRELCTKIEVLHELEPRRDLLKSAQHGA